MAPRRAATVECTQRVSDERQKLGRQTGGGAGGRARRSARRRGAHPVPCRGRRGGATCRSRFRLSGWRVSQEGAAAGRGRRARPHGGIPTTDWRGVASRRTALSVTGRSLGFFFLPKSDTARRIHSIAPRRARDAEAEAAQQFGLLVGVGTDNFLWGVSRRKQGRPSKRSAAICDTDQDVPPWTDGSWRIDRHFVSVTNQPPGAPWEKMTSAASRGRRRVLLLLQMSRRDSVSPICNSIQHRFSRRAAEEASFNGGEALKDDEQ